MARARLVLVVGGDDDTARACARVAAPWPIVRTKQPSVATDRVRAMKPVVVVITSDVPAREVIELRRVAREQSAPLLELDEGDDAEALRTLLHVRSA